MTVVKLALYVVGVVLTHIGNEAATFLQTFLQFTLVLLIFFL